MVVGSVMISICERLSSQLIRPSWTMVKFRRPSHFHAARQGTVAAGLTPILLLKSGEFHHRLRIVRAKPIRKFRPSNTRICRGKSANKKAAP